MITIIANLRKIKGHIYLLQAIKRVIKKYSSLKLLIVGQGELKNELENFVLENRLGNHVIFLGHRSDVPDILAVSDIFVLPSLWEGMPGSIIEVMFSHTPVIASSVEESQS